jgi:hypothetical protein
MIIKEEYLYVNINPNMDYISTLSEEAKLRILDGTNMNVFIVRTVKSFSEKKILAIQKKYWEEGFYQSCEAKKSFLRHTRQFVKKIPFSNRFSKYDKNKSLVLNTTIQVFELDELVMKKICEDDWDIKKKNGQLTKHDMETMAYMDNREKRKQIDIQKNYYPDFAKRFNFNHSESEFKSFEDYMTFFMSELSKYKQKSP